MSKLLRKRKTIICAYQSIKFNLKYTEKKLDEKPLNYIHLIERISYQLLSGKMKTKLALKVLRKYKIK